MDNKEIERPYKYIGYRISTLLADPEKPMTQKELAELIGVKPNVASYYCGGTRKPKLKELVVIADHFNVSVDYLLGRTDIRTTNAELQAICEYTGLSESAVITLAEMSNQGSLSVWIKTLSYLLENDDFITLISLISEKISIEDKEILIKDHGLSTIAKTIDVLDFKISSQIKSITDTLRETVPEEDKHAGNLNSKIKAALNKGGERRT